MFFNKIKYFGVIATNWLFLSYFYYKVTKESSCGHKIKLSCCEEATPSKCSGKCPKKLSCGHPCVAKCKDSCTKNCEVIVKLNDVALCGHVLSVPCYLQASGVFYLYASITLKKKIYFYLL